MNSVIKKGNGWYAAVSTAIAIASLSCCITMWAIRSTTGMAIVNMKQSVTDLKIDQKASQALVVLNDKRIVMLEAKMDNISSILKDIQADMKTLTQRP